MKLIQPREFNPRKTLFVALVVLAAIVWAYFRDTPAPANPYWTGSSMGTTYSVRIAGWPHQQRELDELVRTVEQFLFDYNEALSAWLATSDLSRFNAHRSTAPLGVSPLLVSIVEKSAALRAATAGAFDPTVGPLVRAWGFGPAGPVEHPPSEQELVALKELVGARLVEVVSGRQLRKASPEVELDINAIAKGHAVDEVAALVLASGATNLFVEIGGECVTRGYNIEGQPWRIGIDAPRDQAAVGEELQTVLHLSGQALATSGDYRNFRVNEAGERVAHIIDPRNGKPVRHDVASVSVIAPTCLEADALSTAFFVMGKNEGLEAAEALEQVEALFIVRNPDGTFREMATRGLAAYQAPPGGL